MSMVLNFSSNSWQEVCFPKYKSIPLKKYLTLADVYPYWRIWWISKVSMLLSVWKTDLVISHSMSCLQALLLWNHTELLCIPSSFLYSTAGWNKACPTLPPGAQRNTALYLCPNLFTVAVWVGGWKLPGRLTQLTTITAITYTFPRVLFWESLWE